VINHFGTLTYYLGKVGTSKCLIPDPFGS